MNELTDGELDALSLTQLVDRMDEFLINVYEQRTPAPLRVIPPRLPGQLMATQMVVVLSEDIRRRIAYCTYSFLLHLEMNVTGSGIANKLLYGVDHDPANWSNPFFRLNEGVLYQYQLVGSRITFEVFMDLLCLIGTGDDCPTPGKSKIKGFKKWILKTNTPFKYFGHVLLAAYQFDRAHRSPVVHGASKLPRRMLLMGQHDSNLANETLGLVNFMSNVWAPLIELASNQRSHMMHIGSAPQGWFDAYMSGDEGAIQQALEQLLESVT